jgi:hypothetical protein
VTCETLKIGGGGDEKISLSLAAISSWSETKLNGVGNSDG